MMADDSPEIRSYFSSIISHEEDMELAGTASSGADAVQGISEPVFGDVVAGNRIDPVLRFADSGDIVHQRVGIGIGGHVVYRVV